MTPPRTGAEGLGPRARRTVGAVAVSGAAVVVVSLTAVAGLIPFPAPPLPLLASPLHALLATVTFAAFFLAFEKSGFVLHWRRHSATVSPDETAIFLGALVLPAPHLVAGVALGTAVTQWLGRRTPVKAAFNVGQYVLAAAAAALAAAAAAALGAPAPWSALPAPVVFSLGTAVATAAVLAAVEDRRVAEVFRERFQHWSLAAGLGIVLGATVFALYELHPLAAALAVPLLLYLRRFGRLSEVADADLRTHQLLSEASARLAGEGDLDRVAEEVLVACHQLLDCGEAEVTIATPGAEPRVWRRSFLGGGGAGGVDPKAAARAPIALGFEAPVGEVAAFPPRRQRAYGERERHVLLTVGAAAAAALANARALGAVREANAQLEETVRRVRNAHRELEEFTLWTTHDVREPLRGVETLAAFLAEDIERMPRSEARDVAERIRAAAGRLKERVKALHAFSRVVQQDRPFEEVDVGGVVRHAVEGLAPKAEEKGAEIRLPAEPFPVVRAQRHRLDIVFGNLVENALKYGPRAGLVVEVGCARAAGGDAWEFFVRDNGPGIPPAYHEHVFQLFQRGPGTREPGSGAGLAIVKRVVEQHGGRVWVESEPGAGATFRFTLPDVPGDPPGGAPGDPSGGARSGPPGGSVGEDAGDAGAPTGTGAARASPPGRPAEGPSPAARKRRRGEREHAT